MRVQKAVIKILGFAGSLLLTTFAGVFAMVGLTAFVMFIVNPSIIGFIGSVGFGFTACICWSIRKDTLV